MKFETLDDLKALILDRTSEGLHLEFKRSETILNSKTSDISKEVCAFANSDGGEIIFGIQENAKGIAERLDGGIPDTNRTTEWLDKIIRTHVQPELTDYSILQISEDGRSFYVIRVGSSQREPHQSEDKRYYKRYGSHSVPMEDYEINDVRARMLTSDRPLHISLHHQSQLLYLRVENTSRRDVDELVPKIYTNLSQRDYRLKPFSSRGLRRLKALTHAEFLIGSFFEIFQETKTPVLHIDYTFLIDGKNYCGREEFDISDFEGQSADPDPQIKILQDVAKGLTEINKTQREICRFLRDLSSAFNTTGLKLSHNTVRRLRGDAIESRHNPYGMDAESFTEILEVSFEMGQKLSSIFGYLGSRDGYKNHLEKLPANIVDRLRKEFDLGEDAGNSG